MIARQWIGETLAADAEAYFNYLEETGVRECKTVKGNLGVWLLRRLYDDKAQCLAVGFIRVHPSVCRA